MSTLGETPHEQLVARLARDAAAHAEHGMSVLDWLGNWYAVDCFDDSEDKPRDEMNVAMSKAIAWVWGPQ